MSPHLFIIAGLMVEISGVQGFLTPHGPPPHRRHSRLVQQRAVQAALHRIGQQQQRILGQDERREHPRQVACATAEVLVSLWTAHDL